LVFAVVARAPVPEVSFVFDQIEALLALYCVDVVSICRDCPQNMYGMIIQKIKMDFKNR
jgi:hypothetical protein